MVVIGINSSHVATACLLKDGKILACISEERLTGVKHQSGMPYLSIAECLRIANLKISDVDYLVFNYLDPKIHMGFSTYAGEKGKISSASRLSFFQKILSVAWFIKEQIIVHIPQAKYFFDNIMNLFYKFIIDPYLEKKLSSEVSVRLGISKSKIIRVEHHTTHIYSAYYGSKHSESKPMLILTLDSMGDGVCATVSIVENGKIRKIASSPSGSSIGDLYTQTTAYLGMKLGEHEYKVMGLAPYASKEHAQSVYDKLKNCVWVNPDLTFGTIIHSHMFYRILPKLYTYERFDNIASALQRFTEEIVCKWVSLAIEKTGIADVACAGGVFMNVKLNQKILALSNVKSLFVTPSASDESTAIGTAYWGYVKAQQKNKRLPNIEPLRDLYFGGEFSEQKIKQALLRDDYKHFQVTRPKDLEAEIAKLLSEGEIVARFSGRMEWGARALGNRSILAHPQRLEVISKINDQIKNRDFWMPFAPSILKEDEKKYIVNKKNFSADYMIMTFDATKNNKEKLRAAMHQSDHTLRPQIIRRSWNPKYYKLIKEFKKITGIGAVLNTSFNLHGFPIVYTPEDALFVFKNSTLRFLSLGPYLILK